MIIFSNYTVLRKFMFPLICGLLFVFFRKKKKKNLIFLSAEVEHFSLRIILSILYFILTDFNIKLFEIRYFNRRSKKKLRGQIFLEHQFILSSIIYKIYLFIFYLFLFFSFLPEATQTTFSPSSFPKRKRRTIINGK